MFLSFGALVPYSKDGNCWLNAGGLARRSAVKIEPGAERQRQHDTKTIYRIVRIVQQLAPKKRTPGVRLQSPSCPMSKSDQVDALAQYFRNLMSGNPLDPNEVTAQVPFRSGELVIGSDSPLQRQICASRPGPSRLGGAVEMVCEALQEAGYDSQGMA